MLFQWKQLIYTSSCDDTDFTYMYKIKSNWELRLFVLFMEPLALWPDLSKKYASSAPLTICTAFNSPITCANSCPPPLTSSPGKEQSCLIIMNPLSPEWYEFTCSDLLFHTFSDDLSDSRTTSKHSQWGSRIIATLLLATPQAQWGG